MKIESGLKSAVSIGRRSVSSQGDEEDTVTIWLSPEKPSNSVSVHAGQADVLERHSRPGRLQHFETEDPVLGDEDFVTIEFEKQPVHLARVLVVFHDQHALSAHSRAAQAKSVPEC